MARSCCGAFMVIFLPVLGSPAVQDPPVKQKTPSVQETVVEQETGGPPAALNLVKNGGFERGTVGKGPLGWQRPDGLTAFWINDPLRGGRVMKFDTNVLLKEYRRRREEMKSANPSPARPKTPPGNDPYQTVAARDGVDFVSDPIPVEKGRRYRLTFDCRIEGGPKRVMRPKVFVVGYQEVRGEMRRVYKVYKDAAARAKWATFTLEFDPTARSPGVTALRVKLFPYWPPGSYYFDDVRIEPLPETGADPKTKDQDKAGDKTDEQGQDSEIQEKKK